MQEVKAGKRIPYNNLHIVAIAALLPLIFGGSLGPEAGLTGVIAGLCFWFSDRFKSVIKEVELIPQIGIAATVGAIFGSPLFGLMNEIEDENEKPVIPKNTRTFLYLLAILCGTGVFVFLNSLIGKEMGWGKFPEISELTLQTWLFAIPLTMIGVMAGLFDNIVEKVIQRLVKPFERQIILKAIVGGVLLGAFGIFLPYTMFAGEHQMKEIMGIWQSMGSLVLLLTGFLKLLVGIICKEFGWRGGKIFPTIFSGVCIGYALAPFLPVDPIFAVAIVTASLTGFILKKPLAVVLLLMICFPVNGLIPVTFGAVVGGAFPKLFSHQEEAEI
ncbi:chloride channel protein [Eubacteriaceae bacterium ES2]|nr:chloride channel protein [Eubacteriaceae bacterium ES2]